MYELWILGLVVLAVVVLFGYAWIKNNQLGRVRCAYCGKSLKKIGLGQRAKTCHHCGREQPTRYKQAAQ